VVSTGPERIISLLPAATEILTFLDLDDRLVGVSSDCDWPSHIQDLPEVSSTSIDETESSRSIDQQVKETAHAGKSLYHIDNETLEDLNSDLVITQEQCDVCAPSFTDVEESCRYLDGQPDILSLEPETLSETLETISKVGNVAGQANRAKRLIDSLKQRERELNSSTNELEKTPRVVCVEWYDPVYQAGHWVPEMVELLGAEPFGRPGSPSRETSLQEVANFQPDHLILMPCGFRVERAVEAGQSFLERLDESTQLTVQSLDVHAVNSSWYFSRPGPRLWDGLDMMAQIIHGELSTLNKGPDNGVRRLV
jgi:iron complex transport system substrate-binding protein